MLLGYVRVSTDEQVRDGLSLEAQEGRIRGYCQAMDLELGEIVREEGISARKVAPAGRPGMGRALEMLSNGEASGLVIVRLDRAVRKLRDLIDLVDLSRREGWQLHSISEHIETQSAIGRAMINLIGVFAELEGDRIGERTQETLAHKRSQGAYLGTPPYGWQWAKDGEGKLTKLEDNPLEQGVRLRIQGMARRGASHQQIADLLTKEGVRARKGRWSRWTVARVLRAE